MKNLHNPQKRDLGRWGSWLRISSLFTIILTGCGDKPKAPEKDIKAVRKNGTGEQ